MFSLLLKDLIFEFYLKEGLVEDCLLHQTSYPLKKKKKKKKYLLTFTLLSATWLERSEMLAFISHIFNIFSGGRRVASQFKTALPCLITRAQ